MLVIKNAYFVEVNLPTLANNQRYYFQDIPQLRSSKTKPVRITGIEAVYNVSLAKSPAGKDMITAPQALMVTLVTAAGGGNKEIVYQMPYYNLVGLLNGGIVKEFNGLEINLVKSYITVTDTSSLTAAQSAGLVFYYE